MAEYCILECYLPYIFNGEVSGDLSEEEMEEIDRFQKTQRVDLSKFSVVEVPDGEWITNFTRCGICRMYGLCVYLVDTPEDEKSVLERFV